MIYNIKHTKLAHITNEYNLMFLYSFNPHFSFKMRKYIINSIETLSHFPNSHPIYKHTKHRVYRKLIIHNLYHIIYFISKNTVVVLYTTDARKEADEYYSFLN